MGLYLHSYILMFIREVVRKLVTFNYTRLVDGVHPTHALSAAWTRHLETTIDINEYNLNL